MTHPTRRATSGHIQIRYPSTRPDVDLPRVEYLYDPFWAWSLHAEQWRAFTFWLGADALYL